MCLPNAGDDARPKAGDARPKAGEAALRDTVVFRDGGCVIVPLLNTDGDHRASHR